MTRLSTSGALIGALVLLVPMTAAQGQDTTSNRDTSTSQQAVGADTSADAQNPQGYRGMERPVNVFPPDSTGGQARSPGEVEDRVTGTYDDSTWQDTTGAAQNPAGYRGMERPAGGDTGDTLGLSAETGDPKAQKTQNKATKKKASGKDDPEAARAAADTSQPDSAKWGNEVNRDPDVKNPPGYRGMERPVNVFPADSGEARDTSAGSVEDTEGEAPRSE